VPQGRSCSSDWKERSRGVGMIKLCEQYMFVLVVAGLAQTRVWRGKKCVAPVRLQ